MPKTKKMSEELKFAVRVLKKANEKGDPMALLAAMNLLKELPADVKNRAMEIVVQADEDGPTITSRGRRADLRDVDPDALIIKVSVAGSGYGKWRTDKEKDQFVPNAEEAAEYDWEKINTSVTCYRRDVGKGPELLFAGPGGAGTTGRPTFGGALDGGSNSIDDLVREVPIQVEAAVDAADPEGTKPIVLLIRAHSRGAVAADQAANQLKNTYKARGITVELVLVDPVPGPGQSGEKKKIDVGGLDESTLVMSVNPGFGFTLNDSFTPQRVYGAKRIIISTQAHGVGLSEGFVYKNRRYKGSSMNSLPEGIYVDRNETGQSDKELDLVASLAKFNADIDNADDADDADQVRADAYSDARSAVKAAQKSNPGKNTGARLKVIDKVLQNYLGV